MIPLFQIAGLLQVGGEQEFEVAERLHVAIAVFAHILLGLSLSAYRKTHLSRLLIVSAAFGLFAVTVLFNQLNFFVLVLSHDTERVISALLDFFILLLFFVAVVRKEKPRLP